MGFYSGTYFGVYMEVPYKQETITEIKIFHPLTGNEMKTPFDPQTGEKGIEKIITKIEMKSPRCAFEEADKSYGFESDEFWTPEFTVVDENHVMFIINIIDSKFRLKIEESNNRCFSIDLNVDYNVKELISEFKEFYKKEIKYLEENYGPVKIKCGVVHYYH